MFSDPPINAALTAAGHRKYATILINIYRSFDSYNAIVIIKLIHFRIIILSLVIVR